MIVPLVVLAAQFGNASDPRRLYAAGAQDAFLMMPPETVCGAESERPVWTGDGEYLVIPRQVVDLRASDLAALAAGAKPTEADLARLRPRRELVVWSVRSRKIRTLLTTDATTFMGEISPMPGSDRLFFTSTATVPTAEGGTRSVDTIMMVAAGSGVVARIAMAAEGKLLGFGLSPSRPLGHVVEAGAPKTLRTVRFFGTDGRLGSSIALPPKSELEYDERGVPVVFLGAERKSGKPVFHFQRVDPVAGKLGALLDLDHIPDVPEAPKSSETLIVNGTADGARAPSIFLAVAGGKAGESGVVTTDGTDAVLSPKGDAVAYLDQGSAMVRMLVRVPRAQYDAARLAAEKTVALSNAKQAALALILYASDSDDQFPTPGDYDKIEPYLKNRAIMNSFTYTFGGGDMTKIDRPANTEVGYVSGPGGRAVAYADGHVKWIPDAP